jgi:hypothetical protein
LLFIGDSQVRLLSGEYGRSQRKLLYGGYKKIDLSRVHLYASMLPLSIRFARHLRQEVTGWCIDTRMRDLACQSL